MGGPHSLGPVIMGVSFSLTSISTILVALRLYCRVKIIQKVTLDDYLILIALLNGWGLTVSNYFQAKLGTGTHTADLVDYEHIIIPTLKLWYAYQIQYILQLWFIKMSILCFFHRLSPSKPYRRTVYAVGIIVTTYTIVMIFVNIFECPKDISRAWHIEFPTGCNDLASLYYAMAGFNIGSDIAIFILPLPTLMGLHINRKKRIALILIFSVGSIAVIASMIRFSALHRYQTAAATGGDVPYVSAYILIWSQVEVNLAIASSSAPSLKPLMKSVLNGSSYGSKEYGETGLQNNAMNSTSKRLSQTGNGLNRIFGKKETFLDDYSKNHMTSNIGRGSANTSQENIIPSIQTGGILRTTEVKIDIEMGTMQRPKSGDSEDSLRRLEYGL